MTKVAINRKEGEMILTNKMESSLAVSAFDPSDLLAGALAKCTAHTVGKFARNKNFELEDFSVSVDLEKDKITKTANFKVHLDIKGDLSERELKQIHKVARKSYISRLLSNTICLATELRYNGVLKTVEGGLLN